MKNIKLRYDSHTEEESRIIIKKDFFDNIVTNGLIRVIRKLTITQYWLNSDVLRPLSMRIRHTRDVSTAFHTDTFEHTVKYPIDVNTKLEVNTLLSVEEYNTIKQVVHDKSKDKKLRLELYINDWDLNNDYMVTADIKFEDPDNVVIEFEKKTEHSAPLRIPSVFNTAK